MTLPIYITGTVTVDHLGTAVTGAGVMWSGINAREGDFFVRADGTAVITEVTDATHLKITPWPGASVVGGVYAIEQNYVGRVVGVAAAEDVGVMLEKLHTDGLPFIVGADETVPDPSYGDEGQLAFRPSTGQWWVKQGGVWVPSAGLTALGYGGTSASSVLIGLSPPAKVFTTQNSLAYNGARVRAASAANLNNFIEGVASYAGTTLTITADIIGGAGTFADWLFSVAGQKGATGSQGPVGPAGPTGPIGPTGASGTGAGNVVGPASAVGLHVAVFNGTTGTIIMDGGKSLAELAGVLVSDGAPPVATTNDGALWWESDTGALYVLYNDGTSRQWVSAGGPIGPTGPPGATGPIGPTGATGPAGGITSVGGLTGAVGLDPGLKVNANNIALKAGLFTADRNGSNQTGLTAGADNKIVWTQSAVNTEGWFSVATGKYTPQVPGTYIFVLATTATPGTGGESNQAVIFKNGAKVKVGLYQNVNGPVFSGLTAAIPMNGTTDFVEAYIYLPATIMQITGVATATHFQGWRGGS